MGRASRTTLVTTVGVVASLTALLLAGRLTGPRPPLVRKVALSQPVDGVAVAEDDGVWIVHHGRLSRVDPRTLWITAFVAERRPVTAVAAGAGAVWASAGEELLPVDPRTAEVVARLPVATGAGLAGVWVRSPGGPIWRVDPARNRLAATVRVPGGLGTTTGSVLVAGAMVASPTRTTAPSTSSTATA